MRSDDVPVLIQVYQLNLQLVAACGPRSNDTCDTCGHEGEAGHKLMSPSSLSDTYTLSAHFVDTCRRMNV